MSATRKHALRDRLAQDKITLTGLCNYRAAAELFVELTFDPQAPENTDQYRVLYTQLLGIARKNLALIDLRDALKITLTRKNGAVQARYQILNP